MAAPRAILPFAGARDVGIGHSRRGTLPLQRSATQSRPRRRLRSRPGRTAPAPGRATTRVHAAGSTASSSTCATTVRCVRPWYRAPSPAPFPASVRRNDVLTRLPPAKKDNLPRRKGRAGRVFMCEWEKRRHMGCALSVGFPCCWGLRARREGVMSLTSACATALIRGTLSRVVVAAAERIIPI